MKSSGRCSPVGTRVGGFLLNVRVLSIGLAAHVPSYPGQRGINIFLVSGRWDGLDLFSASTNVKLNVQ